MGFLTKFEDDVFISYAHFDDDRVLREKEGWVLKLYRELVNRVRVRLGKDPSVWLDQGEVRSHDDFENKISRRLKKTAILLSIVSPSFLQREWCQRELREFVEQAERDLGIHIDEERLRVFKADKLPVPTNDLPAVLQRQEGYKFHDPQGHEYRPMLNEEHAARFFTVMDDLAKDIVEMLKTMETRTRPGASETPERPAVYLGEPASDLEEAVLEVRRDLKDRGYTVLPAGSLPYRVRELSGQVKGWLERAALSVHLVGNEYGVVPEGEREKSMAWLQYQWALEQGARDGFTRLVWIPGDVEPSDERQRRFIQYLEEDPGAQTGSDVLRTHLENLKAAVQEKLRAITAAREKQAARTPAAAAKSAAATTEPPLVYLICDRLDRESAPLLVLKKYLFDQGYDVMLPIEDQDEREALRAHTEILENCDACLIYYGQGSDRWFGAKLMDFRKILRLRQQPVRVKAIYVAPPDTPGKRELATHEAIIVRGAETFAPGPLDPFLHRVSNGGGERR